MLDKPTKTSIGVTMDIDLNTSDIDSYTYFSAYRNKKNELNPKLGMEFKNDDINLEIDNVNINYGDVIITYNENIKKIRTTLFEDYNFEETLLTNQLDDKKVLTNPWVRKLNINGGFFGMNFLKKWINSEITIYDFDTEDNTYESDFKIGLNYSNYSLLFAYDTDSDKYNTFYIKTNFDMLGVIGFGFQQEDTSDTFYFWNDNTDTYMTGLTFNSESDTHKIYFKGNIVPSEHFYVWSYSISDSSDDDDMLSLGYGYNSLNQNSETVINQFEVSIDINFSNTTEKITSYELLTDWNYNNMQFISDYIYKQSGTNQLVQTISKDIIL